MREPTSRQLRDQEDLERAQEMQESGASDRGLPIHKKYRVNPQFSRTPTAICSNIYLGLPTCEKGEDRFCYSREVCECQAMLDGSGLLTKEAKTLFDRKAAAAVNQARRMMDQQEGHGMSEYELREIIKRILD